MRPFDGAGGNRRSLSVSHFKEIYAWIYQISNNFQLLPLSVSVCACSVDGKEELQSIFDHEGAKIRRSLTQGKAMQLNNNESSLFEPVG